MTTGVTIRLSDQHMEWIKSTNKSVTEAIRAAINKAIKDESYRDASEVLRRIPLDTEDDWGNPEDFMLRARPDEG